MSGLPAPRMTPPSIVVRRDGDLADEYARFRREVSAFTGTPKKVRHVPAREGT